jgi:hypothetical protein
MNLKRKPVLMLNNSFEPIRITHAQHALKLVTKGKAVVTVAGKTQIYPFVYIPSVIRLVDYAVVPYKRPIPSRRNIFTRDNHRCLYCGRGNVDLELEHVIPRSRGGQSSWENLVAACRACNSRKDNRTPEEANMPLIHRPLPAGVHTNRFILKMLGAEFSDWSKYLWNDSKGEERLQFA